MCHLRGVLMLKLNRADSAKQCFMEALALDVKCYDAFDQLISGEMMTADEGSSDLTRAAQNPKVTSPEWNFVQGLAYASQAPQDSQFVQLIYTSRLRKYKHATEHTLTRQRLVDEYGLGDNPTCCTASRTRSTPTSAGPTASRSQPGRWCLAHPPRARWC